MDPTTLDKLQQILGPSAQVVINGAIRQVYIDGVISTIVFLVALALLPLAIRSGKQAAIVLVGDDFSNTAEATMFGRGALSLTLFTFFIIALVGFQWFAPHMLNPEYWAYKNLLP